MESAIFEFSKSVLLKLLGETLEATPAEEQDISVVHCSNVAKDFSHLFFRHRDARRKWMIQREVTKSRVGINKCSYVDRFVNAMKVVRSGSRKKERPNKAMQVCDARPFELTEGDNTLILVKSCMRVLLISSSSIMSK